MSNATHPVINRSDTEQQHFKEQVEDETPACRNATLSCNGALKISADDDVGSDPYNRTGRFTQLKRVLE